jgi:hypothetical protein
MTSVSISYYYKWSSLVTFIVSIMGPLVLIEGTLVEKFWMALLVNLQFHFAFQFLSRLPYGIYKRIERENPGTKIPAYKILNIFSWIMMILSIMGFVGFLNSVIAHHHYEQLMVTMTFIAIFLGGYSSYLKLKEG